LRKFQKNIAVVTAKQIGVWNKIKIFKLKTFKIKTQLESVSKAGQPFIFS
jgi:hypothetical protein